MNEDLIIYEAQPALLTPKGRNYVLNIGNTKTILKRDVDFGVIPGTQKPSLFKSGAEAIAMGYGLLQHMELVSITDNWDGEPFFRYIFKCSLCKVVNGQEYVFSSAYGSANTREKRNGRNDAFNSDNSTLKIAQKRALTSAAIAVSGLSSAFTMDVEDMGSARQIENITNDVKNPDEKISGEDAKRLYAFAITHGLSKTEIKPWLKEHFGLDSSKEITYGVFDDVIAELQKGV